MKEGKKLALKTDATAPVYKAVSVDDFTTLMYCYNV